MVSQLVVRLVLSSRRGIGQSCQVYGNPELWRHRTVYNRVLKYDKWTLLMCIVLIITLWMSTSSGHFIAYRTSHAIEYDMWTLLMYRAHHYVINEYAKWTLYCVSYFSSCYWVWHVDTPNVYRTWIKYDKSTLFLNVKEFWLCRAVSTALRTLILY